LRRRGERGIFTSFRRAAGVANLDLACSVERSAESLGEGTLISLVFAGLGLLFAGLLVYRLARGRKKKPGKRGG
jgi:amino acid transporter